jgi:hypothetical protein
MNELINEVTNEWVNDIYWICCCYKLQLRCRTFDSLVFFFSGFYLYLSSLHFLYCTILFIYFSITSNFPLFTACFLIVFPANLFYLSLYFSSIFYTSLVLLEAIFLIQIYWSIFITFFQQSVPPIFCSHTSQDVTPSFLFPTCRANPLVSISPHSFITD